MEETLADQIPAAIKMKKLYNIYESALALPAAKRLSGSMDAYVGFRNVCFFRDSIVVRPDPPAIHTDALRAAGARISERAAASPDAAFYVYYIESDRDINFTSGQKSGLYEELSSALRLPAGNVGRLPIDSYDDYRRCFLATDHHWNAEGAREGYEAICGMLGFAPMEPLGVYTDHGRYLGTRAAGLEGLTPEDFSVTLYDCPPMEISSSGSFFPDYGQQSLFASGQLQTISYGSIYGPDAGELRFRTRTPGRTALVLGDSYDNAILKALASHFETLYSVDLRAYQNGAFDMNAYISEHGIDLVLFVGAVDFYTTTIFSA